MRRGQLRPGDTASAKLSVARLPEGTRDSSSREPRLGSPTVRPRLLGIHEAASLLSISSWTLREMIWRGDLPEVRIGRRVLIDTRDLDALVERSKHNRKVT